MLADIFKSANMSNILSMFPKLDMFTSGQLSKTTLFLESNSHVDLWSTGNKVQYLLMEFKSLYAISVCEHYTAMRAVQKIFD